MIATVFFEYPAFQGAAAILVAVLYLVAIMKFEPFINSAFNHLDALLTCIEMGVVIFGYMWAYNEDNVWLERAMVMALMAYPAGVLFACLGEIIEDDLETGSQRKILMLHKQIKKTLRSLSLEKKDHYITERNSMLENMHIGHSHDNSRRHSFHNLTPAEHMPAVTQIEDILLGCCTKHRKKGRKGHEEGDAICSLIDAISPWEFSAWSHNPVG